MRLKSKMTGRNKRIPLPGIFERLIYAENVLMRRLHHLGEKEDEAPIITYEVKQEILDLENVLEMVA